MNVMWRYYSANIFVTRINEFGERTVIKSVHVPSYGPRDPPLADPGEPLAGDWTTSKLSLSVLTTINNNKHVTGSVQSAGESTLITDARAGRCLSPGLYRRLPLTFN